MTAVDDARFMERMNDALAGAFGAASLSPVDEPLCTGHIVGLPRSGTTITSQLLAASGAVGYPSNVMAPFWRVPVVGAWLQARLSGGAAHTSLASDYGRTYGPLEPHEFGYFWRDALGHSAHTVEPDREPMPPEDLQRTLDTLTAIFGKPTVHKNFYAARHIQLLRDVLLRQRFLVVDRDPLDVAASILVGRRTRGLRPGEWLGPRPVLALEAMSEAQLIAAQVFEIMQWLPQAVSGGASLLIPYRKLCAEPRVLTATMLEILEAVPEDGWQERIPERLEPSPGAAMLTSAERDELRSALVERHVVLEGLSA